MAVYLLLDFIRI